VAGRPHAATTAFRPSAPRGPRTGPSRTQTIALLSGVILIAAGIAVASFVVKPSKARSFDLFYGSMFLDDNTSPVAVDLASGKPTVRLRNAFTAVSAKTTGDLDVTGLDGGNTLMLNRSTGEFNMVDSTGFVVKPTGGGVRLPRSTGAARTSAVPAGESAYLLQSGPSRSSIFLVTRSTVSSAIGRNAQAKARASGTIALPVADVSAPAASANGDLWLLTGSGSTGGTGSTGSAVAHPITQLTVPPRSNAGAMLQGKRHGAVSGVAAVASATRNADGTGGEVAAVASASQIRVFGDTSEKVLPVRLDGTVTDILPASNAQGSLVFLYRTTSAWSVVSTPASNGTAVRVSRLQAIDPNARLVMPAESDGRVYTMDTLGRGVLWQLDADGSSRRVTGADTYPVLRGEKGDLSESQVIARGSRVVFNARANYQAEIVFSDGSHAPRTIDKHSAVQVDPSGATALTEPRVKTTKPPSSKPPKSAPRPAQPVNDKIDCRTTTQTPHIPTLIAGERGSRSVVLTWVYPLLENTDCAPSTYAVSVKLLTAGSPSPPSRVVVQGQNGVTLTGLFPATQYEMTVTAYINNRGTSSQPIRVSTGPEGPAAPSRVRVDTPAGGDWVISWSSCGGIKQGCVPSTTWNIVPRFCDGRGLSNVPSTLSITGDPTVHSFSRTYPGSDALLGRGLCFAVQGVSPQGTSGTLSSFSAPAYSWSLPIAGALQLSASQPNDVAFGGTTSTTVDLNLGSNPVRAVGGLGATIIFTLTGPDGRTTKSDTFGGRSNHIQTTFPGIRAGAHYTVQASVRAPNHPSVTATSQVTVQTRANWPKLSADANCTPDSGAIVVSCTLNVRVTGLSSAAAGGELFALTDSSGVVCGNTGFPLSKTDFDPATGVITRTVSLLDFNGACTVNLQLQEGANAREPKVFGGTPSAQFSTAVNLGQASTLDATASQFSAKFVALSDGSAAVDVQFGGDSTAAAKLAYGWHEQIYAPDGTTRCGGDNAGTGGAPDLTISVSPSSCVVDQGGTPGWSVTLGYRDKRDGTPHTFEHIAISGLPPGFIPPCRLSQANFQAAWSGSVDAPSVTVTFDPSHTDLGGCTNLEYTLQEPGTKQTCTSVAVDNPPPATAEVSAMPCQADLSQPGSWSIEVTYKSARNDAAPIDIVVSGTPPQ
jgi:hypothetical protein